jgi:hypothetical protein
MQIVNLPKIEDHRGNLSFIEEENHIPFKIRRVYWVYDVPGGEFRGSHAFKESEEYIVAISGSFDVILHNGIEEKLVFRRLENFSTNSLALILASTTYAENDYIRDFDEFLTFLK